MSAQATVRGGGVVAYIDAEHGLSPVFAKAFGLIPSSPEEPTNFGLFQPRSAEECLNLIGYMLRLRTKESPDKSPIDLIVLDSVPGMVPEAILAGEVGDHTVAALARHMATFFYVYQDDLASSGTALLMINQTRDDIGAVAMPGRQKPERIPGGQAVKFYSWIIARVNYPEALKEGGKIVAKNFKITVRKNKLAQAGRKAAFMVWLDGQNQPSPWDELAEVGKELGVFTKEDGITPASQGYWWFQGEKLGVGVGQTTDMLKADEDLARRVHAAIRVALDVANDTLQPADADAEDEIDFEFEG